MKKTQNGSKLLTFPTFWLVAVILFGITWSCFPAYASSPTGHIIIAEQVIREILKDPHANPELKDLLRGNPAARSAFSGGACAPDLDSISDRAHTEDPKGVADRLMQTARNRFAEAQAALAAATTPDQKARAEQAIQGAKCDLAFAYGWLTHAAADLETHPAVNADGGNYWEDSTATDQAWHGEWEAMQEKNWIDKYGRPMRPDVDYRLDLLAEAFGLDRDALEGDVETLGLKTSGAEFVGNRYWEWQLTKWERINGQIGDRSIARAMDFLKSPSNPLDDSCWDIGWGISIDDFRKFIEDTKKANGGQLPENFWGEYSSLFSTWKSGTLLSGSTGAASGSGISGTGTGSTSGATAKNPVPPPTPEPMPEIKSSGEIHSPPTARTPGTPRTPPEAQPAPMANTPWQ